MESIRSVGPMVKPEVQKYKVVQVYKNTGRKITLRRNLSLEEAKTMVNNSDKFLNSMVVFYKQ